MIFEEDNRPNPMIWPTHAASLAARGSKDNGGRWRSKSFNRSFLAHKVPLTSPIKLTFKSAFGVCKISLAAWLSLPSCVCVNVLSPCVCVFVCVCLLSTRTFAFYVCRGTCNTSARRSCPRTFSSFTQRGLRLDFIKVFYLQSRAIRKANFWKDFEYCFNVRLIEMGSMAPLWRLRCGSWLFQ